MFPAERPVIPALSCLMVAATATAAAGLLSGGLPPLWAGIGCAAWAVAGIPLFGLPALAAALPALGLLPGSGLVGLAGWAAVALATTVLTERLGQPDPDRLRRLRNELRDVEHERTLLSRHLKRYPELIETSLELSAAREPDQFAQVLCERSRRILPEATEARVFLGHGPEQICRASSDQTGKPCPREAGLDERYVAGEARSLLRRQGRELRALIPLRGDRRLSSGEIVPLRGVLALRLTIDQIGDHLVIEMLDALGRLGGLGLAAVDLVNQTRSLALHDDLTGLFGQHEFLRRLDEQAAACRRRNEALGVIMCDLDHLKSFNDRFGHPAGDAALRAVAAALQTALPAPAIVCRYGGEEFAALIPGTNARRMAEITEQVRAAVAAARPDPNHPERSVTASLGWTLLHDSEPARAPLARADQACYRAKSTGRDRVEAAP